VSSSVLCCFFFMLVVVLHGTVSLCTLVLLVGKSAVLQLVAACHHRC
jgi:hypothetical protein